MSNTQPPAQFDWATELSDAQGHVTLSAQEAKEIGARLRSMGAKLKTYEDLGDAADDMQLLRMGYAAARLEIESLKAQPAAQQLDIENLRRALRFYADGEHFIKSDDNAWDTVSGEPQNYWCDEAGTATVEDGSIARLALSGQPVQFEDDTPQSEQPGAAYAALAEQLLRGAVACGSDGEWVSIRRHIRDQAVKALRLASPAVSGYVSEWAGGICTADEAMTGIAKLYGAQAATEAQAAPAAVAGCTRSHPHENMDRSCRAKTAIAEMQSKAARGAEATAHDLDRFVALLTAKPTTKPSPAAQGDALDAARYRWLTADHHKQEDRIRVYEIATSMNVRGKGHIDAAIDAARAAQEG